MSIHGERHSSRTPTVLASVLALVAFAQAAKVVRFYDPWRSIDTVHLTGYYPLAADIAMTRIAGTDWVQAVIPDTSWASATASVAANPASPIGIQFTHPQNPYATYCQNGLSPATCADFDIRAALAASDTVWIVPQPISFGPAIVSGVAPVFLYTAVWNPWEYSRDSTPAVQVDSGGWTPLQPIPGNSGWWIAQVAYVGHLDVVVAHDTSGKGPYFTASGTNSAQPAPAIRLDSLARPGDTIWLRSDSGKVVQSSSPGTPTTLMVYNPWNGQFGVDPQASFDGGATWLSTEFVQQYCGWYEVRTYDAPAKVRISNGTGTTSADIPLTWTSDTLFLSNVLASPTTSPYFDGITGVCLVTDLAATIRDFDSTTSPDFEAPTNVVPQGLRTGLVQTTLGTDGTPVQTTAGSKYFLHFSNWFHDVAGINSTTCIDIPLALTAQGTYAYYDSTYFPIDTFQDPHNNLITQPTDTRYTAKEDGKLHNFSFCLESHAQFTYTPGQTFTFSGDDDVWMFINNQLVIDLGGIHAEATSTIGLDNLASTIGLVAGQTYPWDFFFCERHTTQSHLRISTDLDLQTRANFTVKDTVDSANGTIAFTIFGSRPGQGCAAVSSRFESIGKYVLSGPAPFPSPQVLGGGTSYGGITVDPAFGSVKIDTSKMVGLPPGHYQLRVSASSDSTIFQTLNFTVPTVPIPVFAGSKSPFSGQVGTGLWIPVTELYPDTRLASGKSIPFVVHTIPGLSLCLDSLCVQPLPPGDTLMTGTGGIPRRIWVRGTAAGTYSLVVGNSAADSTDVRANLTFVGGQLRFVDSSWRPLASTPAIELPVRTVQQIRIASFALGAICPACQDTVALSALFPGLEFLAGPAGPAIGTLVLSGGEGTFWITSAVPVDSTSLIATPSRGADSTKATWTPVTFIASRPDSGWFLDLNGDGRVDGATIFLHQPWSTANVLRLSWPGLATTVTVLPSEISVSADSLTLSVHLGPGRAFGQDLTSISGADDSLGQWSWDGTWPLLGFPMADRVAPVPVSAVYAWASGPGQFDTLRVAASETLGALTDSDVVRVLAQAGIWTPGGQAAQSLDPSGTTLILLYDPTKPEPAPGDSLRFAAAAGLSDLSGNRPGDSAKSVAIQGSDRLPRSARMVDTNADGRADEVVLRFPYPLHATQALGFLWPDPATGALDSERVPLSKLEVDSGGLLVIAHLDPAFAFGSTSCPAAGCASLGWMESDAGADTLKTRFAVQDGVVPVITSATLRYAFQDSAFDTLKVVFSEPVSFDSTKAAALAPLISWGHPSADSSGAPVPYAGYLPAGPAEIDLLVRVSDSFLLVSGDSVRITAKPQGSVSDTSGNSPGNFAHWTPVVFGPTPLRLTIKPYTPVRTYTGWTIPASQPNVTVLVRGGPDSPWQLPDGTSPGIDTSHVTGVVVRTDREVLGGFFMYDNLGVFVTSADLTPVNTAIGNKTVPLDPRGFYEVFFAWDGRASNGRPASSGVYLVRLYGWKKEGNQSILVNDVQNIGWRIPAKN